MLLLPTKMQKELVIDSIYKILNFDFFSMWDSFIDLNKRDAEHFASQLEFANSDVERMKGVLKNSLERTRTELNLCGNCLV